MGAIYGITYYGTDTYGQPVPAELYAQNFQAAVDPLSYNTITISWDALGGTWDHVRLVRGAYGFPTDETDGHVLIDGSSTFSIGHGSYSDVVSEQLKFYYYSMFLRSTSTQLYSRAGNAFVLSPQNYGFGDRLYELLPLVYRDNDGIFVYGTNPTDVYGSGPLQRFLSLFGYELDVIRSELETLRWVNDPVKIAGGLLPYLAAQLGMTYEAELGMRLARQQIRNAVYLYKVKGTQPGIEGAVSVLTGWAPTIQPSTNLMTDNPDSMFDVSLGRWIAVSDCKITKTVPATPPVTNSGTNALTMTGRISTSTTGYLPVNINTYASTPSDGTLSITGDFDLIVRVAMDDWSGANAPIIFGKTSPTSATGPYYLGVSNTNGNGTLFLITVSGGVFTSHFSSSTVGFTAGTTHWIRAVFQINGGANRTTFYTSPDGTTPTWTQLGTVNTTGTALSIDTNTQPLMTGGAVSGRTWTGRVYYAELRNTSTGTGTVANPDFTTGQLASVGSITDGLGRVWTVTNTTPIDMEIHTPGVWGTGSSLPLLLSSPNNPTYTASLPLLMNRTAVQAFPPAVYGVPVAVGASLPLLMNGGQTYTFSTYIIAGSTARNAAVRLFWYDNQSRLISTTTGTATADNNATWTRLSVTSAVPPRAVAAGFGVIVYSAITGEQHSIDAAQFEVGATPTTWQVPRQINIALQADRINRIENPSFTTNTTLWTVTGATLSRVVQGTTGASLPLLMNTSTVPGAFTGSAVGQLIADGTANEISLTATNNVVVVPGERHHFSAYFLTYGTARPIGATVVWLDGGGNTLLTDTNLSGVMEVTGTWTRSVLSSLAPTHAKRATVTFTIAGVSASEVHYIDAIMAEQADAPGDYFDSSFIPAADYLWEGTANLSRSHYYRQRAAKNLRLTQRLPDFVPAGATIGTFLYAQPLT